MDEQLARVRRLCLDQAEGFIGAATRLLDGGWPHIVYHLSLLALEEVGKAGMAAARMIRHPNLDASWIDRALDDHRRKLQWAVWSPLSRIDPHDLEQAREFAERSHAMRLASLYVDVHADLAAVPPSELVSREDAVQALTLAQTRLEYERTIGIQGGPIDELAEWFLDAMGDPELSKLLLSRTFRNRFEALGADARAWASWARQEIGRIEQENRQILEAELARPAAPIGRSKPRWRANVTIYSASHSLRPKILGVWNEHIKPVQLLWTGKKDQFTLQVTLNDNQALPHLAGRLASLSKLVVACLNIGSIGYFWFQPPGFEHQIFKDIDDLDRKRKIAIEAGGGFWGDGRKVALTETNIEHASRCMMAFAALPEVEAEPIFRPYFDGLALIAKSDVFYSLDDIARHCFVAALAGAFRKYGGWNGEPATFEACFHEQFSGLIPEAEHRDQMLQTLRVEGDKTETPLANLRCAKQLSDLYLLHVAQRAWRTLLERQN